MNKQIIQFGKAIADPTRQEIMKQLCCEWITISDLAQRVGIKQPTATHHISILHEAGLIIKRKEGKHLYCTLDQAMVTVCCGELVSNFAPIITPSEIAIIETEEESV